MRIHISKPVVTFFSGVLFLAIISSNSYQAVAADSDVVASIGSKTLTLKDFKEKYDEILKQTINPPTKEVFLEDLVRFELGVQEAQKRNMQDDPIVKERFKQEMYKGLIERELNKGVNDIKVTDKEMSDWYKNRPEVRTSHILIEFRPDATAEQKKAARDRANELLQEVLKSKRPFEELVGLYTDDVLTKKSGGDVGWQSSVTLVPNYYDTALKLKVGEINPSLIETQYGFHIIKSTGRRAYEDANKRQVRAAVFEEKRKELFNAFFDRLKKQYTIKTFKEKLK
jgi:parvulin-like peptidyl-prolyl isomerase